MPKPPPRNPYPLGLIVDIHDFCNAGCIMCPYPSVHKSLEQGHMEWPLYTRIVDDFSGLIARYSFQGLLTFCNMGEPFIEKDLARYTAYAEGRGIEIYLNTNGSLMTPDRLDALFDSGFHGRFNVSFHGATKEVYEKIMGLGYEATLKNLEYLAATYPPDSISINVLDYQWPPGERAKMESLLTGMGLNFGITKPISRTGLVAALRKKQRGRIAGCGTERVLYQMIVGHSGDVLLCCQDMSRKTLLGNLRTQSIQEVWNGKAFAGYLKKMYSGRNIHPPLLCHACEESIPYWSLKSMVKRVLPVKWVRAYHERRENKWEVSKKIPGGKSDTGFVKSGEKKEGIL